MEEFGMKTAIIVYFAMNVLLTGFSLVVNTPYDDERFPWKWVILNLEFGILLVIGAIFVTFWGEIKKWWR